MANRSGRQGLKATIYDISQRPIVQGGDAFIVTQTSFLGDGCLPYPFDNIIGATGYFEDEHGEETSVSGFLESQPRGLLRFPLPRAFTDTLATGDEQSMEVVFLDNRGLTILPITGKIAIAARFLDGSDPCAC